jgi:hypothetical protein
VKDRHEIGTNASLIRVLFAASVDHEGGGLVPTLGGGFAGNPPSRTTGAA